MSANRPPDHLADPDALADHAAFVRAVARAALRGDDAVDDVVQDTYVAALGSAPRNPGALRAWLAGIVRRQAAARIRKRGIRRRNPPRTPPVENHDSTLDVAIRAETSRHLVDAVLSLAEPYRSALLLRYWDDLPPREIAKRKGVPVETVRTWCKRGLARLRARLEQDSGKGGRGWRAALLPLAAVPEASALAAAASTLGGALVMKKVAVVGAVLLLLASGLWWGTRDPVDVARDEPAASTPVARTPPPEASEQAPVLAARSADAAPAPEVREVVEGPFRGRVVDPSGVPVPGVRIEAMVWFRRTAAGAWSIHSAPGRSGKPLMVATSGAEGGFSFPVTPDGTADDPENPCVAVDVTATVAAYVPAGVRLELGDEAELRLQRGGALVISVVSPEGEPVSGAHVAVQATTGKAVKLLRSIAPSAKGFKTGEKGIGETRLPAGRYTVRASGGGRAPGTAKGVEIVEGGRREQVVKLGAGLVISVRVLGPEEKPIAGAHVRLAGPRNTSAQAVSGADGRYRNSGGINPARNAYAGGPATTNAVIACARRRRSSAAAPSWKSSP